MAVAALTLIGGLVQLLRGDPTLSPVHQARLTIVNGVGLSCLQWGWGWPGIPLMATYLGIIVTSLALVYQDYVWGNRFLIAADRRGSPRTDWQALGSALSLSRIAIIGGTLLLLVRALAIQRLPVTSLGLAVGLWGAVLCWLCRRDPSLTVGFRCGLGVLAVGRLVSLNATAPWQGIAITGLALGVLGQRLGQSATVRDRRRSQHLELTLLFLTGLQGIWPLRRLIPDPMRQQMVEACIQVAGSAAGMPAALWGVTGFAYVLLTLATAAWLQRRRQPQLAHYATGLALGLGGVLTLVSLGNPLMRVLNLSLSAITLIAVLRHRRQGSPFLIYLTQLTGLAAIATAVVWGWPQLEFAGWAAPDIDRYGGGMGPCVAGG